MAPSTLEQENHQRDAEFNKALHGKSSGAQGGLAAMRGKDAAAQKAAVDEYFKHWDNKSAGGGDGRDSCGKFVLNLEFSQWMPEY